MTTTGARPFSRGGLGRNALSSAVATGSDFSLMAALVALVSVAPPIATFIGCLVGALVNFTINRLWTFQSRGLALPMAARYGLVSGGSAVLNASLVAALLQLPSMPYVVAWVLVRVTVFVAYNHPLQRRFVFRHDIAG